MLSLGRPMGNTSEATHYQRIMWHGRLIVGALRLRDIPIIQYTYGTLLQGIFPTRSENNLERWTLWPGHATESTLLPLEMTKLSGYGWHHRLPDQCKRIDRLPLY